MKWSRPEQPKPKQGRSLVTMCCDTQLFRTNSSTPETFAVNLPKTASYKTPELSDANPVSLLKHLNTCAYRCMNSRRRRMDQLKRNRSSGCPMHLQALPQHQGCHGRIESDDDAALRGWPDLGEVHTDL